MKNAFGKREISNFENIETAEIFFVDFIIYMNLYADIDL